MSDITNAGAPQGGAPDQGSTPSPQSTPTPIELQEDTYVKLPGSDKPVKWGEHHKGFQSEFTKKAQAASKLENELKQARETLSQREEAMRRLYSEYQRLQQPQQGQQPDPLSELQQLGYVDGPTAYRLAQYLSQQFGGYKTELERRDQAILLMANRLKQLNDMVNGFQSRNAESEFEGKLNKWLGDLGYDPQDWGEFARDVALSHEQGSDFDEVMPGMIKERIERAIANADALKRKRIEAARKAPFVPTRGGQGNASKPMSLAGKTSREVSEILWDQLQNSGEEA